MPTIEVISVDAAQLPPFPRFTSLAIKAEVKRPVRSHRGLFIAALAEYGIPAERAWIKADAMLSKPVRFEQLRRELERLLPGE